MEVVFRQTLKSITSQFKELCRRAHVIFNEIREFSL